MKDNEKVRPVRSKAEQRERREMFGFHPDIVNAGMPMPRPLDRLVDQPGRQ